MLQHLDPLCLLNLAAYRLIYSILAVFWVFVIVKQILVDVPVDCIEILLEIGLRPLKVIW